MDFLRRVLGISRDVPKEDSITITHDHTDPATAPEPQIENPPGPGQAKTSIPKSDNSNEVVEAVPLDTPLPIAGTRPLPPLETVIPKPGQRLVFGQMSDVGMVRGNNQDASFSMICSGTSSDDLPDFGLFIVADGMGGHHDGEKASAMTARLVARHVVDAILAALLDQHMDDPDRPAISDVLRTAVQKANEAVTSEIPEGGTTVTATVILGDLAYIAHVGDSRAYMIADDGIEQITRDHSLVQRLIELDQLTVEEAAEHPQRNVLYRAIGQSDTLDVDAITRRLLPRSRLLLCSDGLWNLVPEGMIREVVSKYSSPQEACNQLVKMANERGGPDNITIILVQMPG
jgi:serine/threonine protein phosphatase PrpC